VVVGSSPITGDILLCQLVIFFCFDEMRNLPRHVTVPIGLAENDVLFLVARRVFLTVSVFL
jgi:hypothetical protein